MLHEYWQHQTSGDIFAIEAEYETPGVAVRCAGPIDRRDIALENLPVANYSTEDVAWVNAAPFRLLEAAEVQAIEMIRAEQEGE